MPEMLNARRQIVQDRYKDADGSTLSFNYESRLITQLSITNAANAIIDTFNLDEIV